jgi:phosphoribosylaminoimidazole (AIR) synthetase
VLNLGIGLIAILPAEAVAAARRAASAAGVATWMVGEVRRGPRGVRFIG